MSPSRVENQLGLSHLSCLNSVDDIIMLILKDYFDIGQLLGAAGTCLQAAAPAFGGGGAPAGG